MPLLRFSKAFFILIVALSVLGISIYYYLGGFEPIAVAEIHQQPIRIGGAYFEGKYDSDTLLHLFDQVSSYIRKNPATYLAVVNFRQYEDKRGRIRQFIGFTGNTFPLPLPSGIQIDTFMMQASVRATIKRHYWVRPKPSAVDQEIADYAQLHNLTLGDYTLEQYISDREMWIDIPIIKK